MTLPIDTEQLATHHGREIGGVVGLLQQALIGRQPTLQLQLAGKALNRHVGQGQQPVEADAHGSELAFVIGLQQPLSWGKRRTMRIEHQIKGSFRVPTAVPEVIQHPKTLKAAFKHSIAPLLVDIGGAVTGQGGDHPDPMVGQKLGQGVLSRLRKNREIAAIDHSNPLIPGATHQGTEVRVKFGSPAGEVQTTDRSTLQHGRNQRHQLRAHHFGPGGTGIDVAVAAALIAAIAEIHLKGGESPALQRGEGQ